MKKILIAALVILFVLSGSENGLAANTTNKEPAEQVIIYMIDKLSIDDLSPKTTPYIWSLKNKAGMGLLNTVTGGERTTKNGCSTISAGKLAVGSSNAHLNYMASEMLGEEKAEDIFFRNTNNKVENDNIVISSIVVIAKNNEKRSLGQAGSLGDNLHDLGLETAVIGNSDRPGYLSRPGSLILMDSRGIVDRGVIGEEVLSSPHKTSLPVESNYTEIQVQFQNLKNASVILVEFGDLSRLEAMYTLFSPQQYQQERNLILNQIDQCIAGIQNNNVSERNHVYIVSPSPSRNSFVPSALLTPLIVVKPGFEGTLTSYSTRREGVVLSTGLKNSILSSLNPAIKETIFATPDNNTYQQLKKLNHREVFSYVNQAWIMSVLISFIMALLLLTLGQVYRKKNYNHAHKLLLFILGLPLSLLLIGCFEVFDRFMFLSLLLLINLLLVTITCLAARLFQHNNPLLFLLTATVTVIAFDLISNTGLIANSIMSYRVISGARYYGLGNEYLGVLIGASISLVTLILHNSFTSINRILSGFIFAGVLFLIAYPLFGINVGGTITACIGLGYTFINLSQHSHIINLRKILLLMGTTLLILLLMALIDLKQAVEIQSHLGHNISLIMSGGLGEVINIVSRKISMQLRIINYTGWIWVFVGAVMLALYSAFRPFAQILQFKERFPIIFKGMQGMLLSAVIAILFNDSGITSAASIFLYTIIVFYYSFTTRIE